MRKVWIIISVIACGAIILVPSLRGSLVRAAFFMARPMLLYGADTRDALDTFYKYTESYKKLLNDNRELRAENFHLKSSLIDYEVLKQENEELAKNIAFIRTEPYGLIATRVIGSFADATGLSLIINGGREQKIAGGALVLAGDRMLVGKVASLYPEFATVSLLRNTGTALGVLIIPRRSENPATSTPVRKPVEGLLAGRGDDLIIDLVPNEAAVGVGDMVITNGFGEGGVRDLLVGEVVSVKKRETTVFQEIHVLEAISAASIRNVSILTEKKK